MIIEDGTGLIDSNSYVSIDFATDYFTSHGVSSFSALTDEEKEIVLIKATDFIDNVFDWYGVKKTYEQALNFPRENLYTKDGYKVEGVPKQLKDAVCEAVSVLISDKDLYQVANENGAVVSENIGGKLSFTYDVSKKIQDSTLYESINLRLRGLYKDNTKKRIYSAEIRRKL